MTADKKPILILPDTYLAMIQNSVGTRMFRRVYARDSSGRQKDIVRNGELACAFFVSFVLHNFKCLVEPHMTVSGTLADMQTSGWRNVPPDQLQPGDVVWGTRPNEPGGHKHIGFGLGAGWAVSTDLTQGEVRKHWVDFDYRRQIESAWRHAALSHEH